MINRKMHVMVAVVVMGLLAGAVVAMGQNPQILGTASLGVPSQYRFIGSAEGWLSGDGSIDIYEETLRGGQHYKITLSGPWSADFDILVFDENENLITKSTGVTSDEVVHVNPRWTGPFFIVVVSYDGRGSYTLKLYREI